MQNSPYTLVLILTCLLLNGCGDGDPPRQARVTPKYDGVILHTFPDGKITGIDTPPASANVFEGLGGEHIITRQRTETEGIELIFEFELLDRRREKDVYQVRREVNKYKQAQENVTSGSGRSATFEIEYDGSPITIANDDYGVTKLMSRELGIQDGQYVDGSDKK